MAQNFKSTYMYINQVIDKQRNWLILRMITYLGTFSGLRAWAL